MPLQSSPGPARLDGQYAALRHSGVENRCADVSIEHEERGGPSEMQHSQQHIARRCSVVDGSAQGRGSPVTRSREVSVPPRRTLVRGWMHPPAPEMKTCPFELNGTAAVVWAERMCPQSTPVPPPSRGST